MVSKKERRRLISKGLREKHRLDDLIEVNSCVKQGMSIFEIALKCGFTPARVKVLLKTLANINHLHNAGEIIGSILGGIGGTAVGGAVGGPAGAVIGGEVGGQAGAVIGREVERAVRPRKRRRTSK